MSNIEKYNNPGLQQYRVPEVIKAIQTAKLRSFKEPERLRIVKDIADQLLIDLAVSGRADPKHHVAAIKLINEDYTEFTVQEIFLAFRKFIKGDFEEKPLQQFNAVVVGSVMSEYKIWKAEQLRVHKSKADKYHERPDQPTQEEKDQIMEKVRADCIKAINTKGKFEDRLFHHLYDYLVEQKKEIVFTKEERKAAFERAKRIEISEAMRDASIHYAKHRQLAITKAMIEKGKSPRTIKLAKSKLIETYFYKHYRKI